MELNQKSQLLAQKEAIRLWFEYLKLAHASKNEKIRKTLANSAAFYSKWDMNGEIKFDVWWKSHIHLFEEKYKVRQMQAGELPNDPDALIIEIPLTQAPSALLEHIKTIVQKASNKNEKKSRKGKKRATAHYKLSSGAEPKLDAVREMLTVYRDVYLKNPRIRGERLLDACHAFYLARKNKRWAKIPIALMPDMDGDKVRAMRNMRRYIQKAEKVLFNVASGEFPGDY